MMKNSEWGAVTYLFHSQYGNTSVSFNNAIDSYGKNITGCGADSEDASFSTVCSNGYGTVSFYPQSTTGNIACVFDMSGGANEQVMGNLNEIVGSSGYYLFDYSKYFDLYTSTDLLTACSYFDSNSLCYGHALSETYSWYNDYYAPFDEATPWFVRGGSDYYDETVKTGVDGVEFGIFSAFSWPGGVVPYIGFRSVLVPAIDSAFSGSTGDEV